MSSWEAGDMALCVVPWEVLDGPSHKKYTARKSRVNYGS
jgi:hypothetical protein